MTPVSGPKPNLRRREIGSEPISRDPENGSEPIFREDAIFRGVCLTFDDGPDVEWTPRVLDILAAARARATFFVVGANVAVATALVRRIAADGHELANHTYSHRHPWAMDEAAARREVRDGATAIADAVGRGPRAYRPPHGRLRRCMVDEALQGGQQTVLWSLSAVDWGPFGHGAGIAARLRRVSAGDIVLMHDARSRHNRPDQLLNALPGFLAHLAARNLRPESVQR